MTDLSRESVVHLTLRQAEAISHLAALFGDGEVRPFEDKALRWVWFRADRFDWCVDEHGGVQGWNDVKASDAA